MNDFLRNEGKFQRIDNITTPAVGEGRSGLDSLEFTDDDYERGKQSLERGNQSRLERIPEAWLVFPEDSGGHQFLSPATAVNLRNAIGSRLQVRCPNTYLVVLLLAVPIFI